MNTKIVQIDQKKSSNRHKNSSNGQKNYVENVRVDNNKGLYKFPVNINLVIS